MAISKRIRFEILRRDNHTCRYCGQSAPDVKLTVDHVVPQALGGSDKPENLVAACSGCNSGKTSVAPDAPLVAQVDADAVRWSKAMATAAQRMLADRTAMQSRHQEFLDAWNNWKTDGGKGQPLPLPTGWENSVERFLIAGLPLPILLDCLQKAMSMAKVKNDGKFKYMCGIAWSLVDELQEQAKSIANGDEPEMPPVHPAVAEFARELLHDAGFDEETEEYKQIYMQTHIFREVDLTGDELAVELARNAIRWLNEESSRVFLALEDLRDMVPGKILEDSKEPLSDLLVSNLGDDYSTGEFEGEFIRVVEGWFASFYLSGLPKEELDDWMEWSRNYSDPGLPFWFDMIGTAKCARRVKRGLQPRKGLCYARSPHGALCPQPALYEFEAASCPWSGEGPCKHTHDGLCAGHVERAVDGATQWPNGDVIDLRDFREADRSNPWEALF